jgi:hypothetical protein
MRVSLSYELISCAERNEGERGRGRGERERERANGTRENMY